MYKVLKIWDDVTTWLALIPLMCKITFFRSEDINYFSLNICRYLKSKDKYKV